MTVAEWLQQANTELGRITEGNEAALNRFELDARTNAGLDRLLAAIYSEEII